MSLLARAALLSLASCVVAAARADEPAFADDPVVRGAIPPELQAVLLEADRFEVLMIACERGAAPDEETLGSYPIIRQVELPERGERMRLLGRLYQGVAGADQGVRAGCFEPHHAVRAWKGEERVELVICFKCSSMLIAHAERGGGVQITDAARVELERHLGSIVDRAFAGRTLAEWRGRMHELARSCPGSPLEPADVEGVRVLADAIGWSGRSSAACAAALRELGPAAAPALPALRRLIDRGPRDDEYRRAVSVIETIGPAAADLAPAITAHLREVVADPADEEAPGLAHAAAGALGGLGPAAREAVPLLEALAADARWPGYVRQQAEVAALRITRR